MSRVLTWVDLQGRYRITSPAYASLIRRHSVYDDDGVVVEQFTEDDCINWVWTVLVQSGKYGIPFEHAMHLVDGEVLKTKIEVLGGDKTRYLVDPVSGKSSGVWLMDSDGTPMIAVENHPGGN